MNTRLKICGITNRHDALAVAQLGVGLLGFNFYPQSPRYIPPEAAAEIIAELPPTTIPVGILVEPTPAQARHILVTSGVRWLQVYQPRRLDYLLELGVPIIYAHRMGPEQPVPWPLDVAYLLLDAYHPKQMGGTGRAFPWAHIPTEIPRHRLVLAGGITPDNVQQALKQVAPAIIDVASGAEKAPGQKDLRKVQQLQKSILLHNLKRLEEPIYQST